MHQHLAMIAAPRRLGVDKKGIALSLMGVASSMLHSQGVAPWMTSPMLFTVA